MPGLNADMQSRACGMIIKEYFQPGMDVPLFFFGTLFQSDMNEIHPALFIIPVLAILVVSGLFVYLYKKRKSRIAFRKRMMCVCAISFILNISWEFMQAPLYAKMITSSHHAALCSLAAIADMIMTLVLCLFFEFLYGEVTWLKPHRVCWMMLAGFAGATVSEYVHLRAGNWVYASTMPLLPVVHVGLAPIAQFTILPVLSYFVAARLYPGLNEQSGKIAVEKH